MTHLAADGLSFSCHGYGRSCVDGKGYTGTPSRWGRQRPIPPRQVLAQPTKWVKNEVVRLKAVMPEAGCRTIVHYFSRRWKSQRQMTVSKPYVTDTCRRHEYLSLTARRKLKHRISRPMPNNCVWGCDLLVRKNRQGQPQLALGILNHASRACCGCIGCPTNPHGR